MAKTLQYQEIVSRLADRTKSAAAKKATAGSGAPGTPSVQVTEKDPEDKGTVEIPKDPSTAPKAQNLPGSGTDSHPNHNKDVTPVKSVGATAPSDTVTDDAGAGPAAKAAKALTAIKDFRASLKSASAPKAAASDKAEKLNVQAPAAEGKPGKMEKEAELTEVDKGKHPVVNADKAAQGPKASQVPEKDPQEEPKPAVREDAVGGVPAKGVNNDNVSGNENTDKAAGFELDPSYHFKLASIVLADADLKSRAEAKLQEALGAEVAADVIKCATVMEQEANAIAELEASGAAEAEELWKSASEAERNTIVKLASLHDFVRGKLATEMEKQAYDMGASAAADEMDQPEAAPAPDAAAGAAPDAAAGAAPDAAAPGAEGGDVSPEDIMAVLQHLVQSGQIDEPTAQAILQELSGGGEGAAPADAGAPAPDAGAAPADAAAAPDAGAGAPPDVQEMADKAASVAAKFASK